MSKSKSKISPTKAIQITGLSRKRVYHGMDSDPEKNKGNKLSYSVNRKGKREIDLAELARWYEVEEGEALKLEESETSRSVSSKHEETGGERNGWETKHAVLLAKFEGQQKVIEQLEQRIEDLQEALGESRSVTRLLTDQRPEHEKRESAAQQKLIEDLSQNVRKLQSVVKRQQEQIEESKNSKNGWAFWKRDKASEQNITAQRRRLVAENRGQKREVGGRPVAQKVTKPN